MSESFRFAPIYFSVIKWFNKNNIPFGGSPVDTIILALALVLALAGLWLLNRATGNLIGSLLGFGIDKEGQTEAMIDQEKVNTGRKQMKISHIILAIVVTLLILAAIAGSGR